MLKSVLFNNYILCKYNAFKFESYYIHNLFFVICFSYFRGSQTSEKNKPPFLLIKMKSVKASVELAGVMFYIESHFGRYSAK
jgi:hypothetical protein